MLSESGKVSTVPRMCTHPQGNPLSVEFYVQLMQFANFVNYVNESSVYTLQWACHVSKVLAQHASLQVASVLHNRHLHEHSAL
jgi:hypothetical protein